MVKKDLLRSGDHIAGYIVEYQALPDFDRGFLQASQTEDVAQAPDRELLCLKNSRKGEAGEQALLNVLH